VALLVERRLRMVGRRLLELRAEVTLADEQLAHFLDDASDAEMRSLVSETPLAASEHREASRHSDAMSRHRNDLLTRIAKLEVEQDELLDKMNSQRRR